MKLTIIGRKTKPTIFMSNRKPRALITKTTNVRIEASQNGLKLIPFFPVASNLIHRVYTDGLQNYVIVSENGPRFTFEFAWQLHGIRNPGVV